MEAKAQVFDNGPIKVEGLIQITDMSGKTWDISGKPAVFLCRCGKSDNAPFCDGAHKREGFVSCPKASGE